MLHEHLKKLDALVNPEHWRRAAERCRAAAFFEPVDRLPVAVSCPVPGWKTFPLRDGFENWEHMLMNELAHVWMSAHVRDDRMFTVRANFGVGGVASMFGCRVGFTDDNAMPWTHHLPDDELDRVLESGEVDIEAGCGGLALETERRYLDVLAQYENLSLTVKVFCADTQGPFDSAHIIMGHKIYTELYDNPERVHRLLDIVCGVYVRYSTLQKQIIGESGLDYHYHSQTIVRGGARLCEDSATNLSPEHYLEFCKPYNERCLSEMGGGWIHFCGSGRQILKEALASEGVTGLNFGNPEMQDINWLYPEAQKRRISIVAWNAAYPLPAGADTGVSLIAGARSLEEARALADAPDKVKVARC